MSDLADFKADLKKAISDATQASLVPGYVAGVYREGEQIEIAHGIANLNTGLEMTADTLWQLGSVTKVLTTTIAFRFAERGKLDLDERVVAYLPDFKLATPGHAEKIRIRNMITHTDGINADAFMPDGDIGQGAVKLYVEGLADKDVIYDVGEGIHYANPGFTTVGRIFEVLTGKTYNQVLKEEVYDTVGMASSVTSPEQAILKNVAIGSFPDPEHGRARPTEMFRLPPSAAGAGATAIVTVPDIIAFGRVFLTGGEAPNGERVLSAESVRSMCTPTISLPAPYERSMGHGWWIQPLGGATALWHGGGSPGGISSLVVIPELDLVIAGFGNSSASPAVHDAVLKFIFAEYLGRPLQPPAYASVEPLDPATLDLARFAGDYAHFQTHVKIEPSETGLTMTTLFVPIDESHKRIMGGYLGSQEEPQPTVVEWVPVEGNAFVPKGMPAESHIGLWSGGLITFTGDDGGDKATHMQTGSRSLRRVAG
jgi:CubicO group peptidase (beta-lactamase class C family)